MPQDAFTLKHITKELSQTFVGGKISKINMPEKDELSLIIYTKTGTLKLEISTSAKFNRISIGKDDKPNPQVAPNFCMLLRKHLQNAEILNIEQIGFERIIRFDFKCFSEFEEKYMSLYCEIMGKYSNLILVEKGLIVGAMKTGGLEENAKRLLFTGAKYSLPESQGKADPTDLKQLENAFENYTDGDVAQFISRSITGLAYSTAQEMVDVYGDSITPQNIYDYVNSDTSSPCVIYLDGQPTDFRVRSTDVNAKPSPTLLQAQTEYYSYAYNKKLFEDTQRKLKGSLSSSIKKLEKRLTQIDQKLFECNSADEIKLKGELITANIYAIQRGATSFEAVNYYEEDCPKVKIELDRQLSPSQNAQKYYKKYAKLKRTVENLTVQREEISAKLDYLKSIDDNISTAETLCDLTETQDELTELGLIKAVQDKKKKVKEITPFREYEIDGFKVLVGRNNVQNDRLLKTLSGDDLWLHTQKFHSSHVGIITQGKALTDEVILKSAQICAYYSEARERDKVAVDYALKRFVKKPPKSHLGFVIYTDYKTIIVTPTPNPHLKI